MLEKWDKQISEPDLWFSFFHRYMMMGPGRSVAQIYRENMEARNQRRQVPQPIPKYMSVPNNWWKMIERWDWRGRVKAWDEHLVELEKQEVEIFRRKLVREKIEIVTKVSENTKRMLDSPVHRQIKQDDDKTIIIEPADWDKADALEYAKALPGLEKSMFDPEGTEGAAKVAPPDDLTWLKEFVNKDEKMP